MQNITKVLIFLFIENYLKHTGYLFIKNKTL